MTYKRKAAAATQREEDKRMEALRKKTEKQQEALKKKTEREKKKAEKKQEAARKKAEKEEKRKQGSIVNKRDLKRISKEEIAKRDEKLKRLKLLQKEAKQELEELKRRVDADGDPSSGSSQQSFPVDSSDDIVSASQAVPLRLSQEERDVIARNDSPSKQMNLFTGAIFQHAIVRLKRRPLRYISPFEIKSRRPDVPMEKALALRKRISYDDNLRQ